MVSALYHKYGVFAVLLGNIDSVVDIPSKSIPNLEELHNIVKTFEFISINSDGLDMLF